MKKRPRSDALVNEKRRSPNSTGRIVYISLLTLFGIAVANYLFGDLVFLRADGLVLQDKTVIATTYVARVDEVGIKEGQHVEKGQVLLRLQSTEMLERLADLSARRARLVADNVEFLIRSESVAELLPLAKKREDEATRVVSKFDELAKSGFSTAASYDTALTSSFNAQQERIKLATQLKTLERELATLQEAREVSEQALSDLQGHYAEGVVKAPVSGSVGVAVPAIGDVYRTGDPIMSIYSGEPYVLAYLPRRYLFSINKDQKVTVSDGRHSVPGVLAEILPVTDMLAREFQNTFKPMDRSQLAKIRLLQPSPFPLQAKVSITARHF
ncbi:MAG: HlyD family efflux transporter periplasmic adaptor subunit [Rhodomicrobium sp.]|nr:HlyD family efflux transporter periplasmic adaptor subunit [Rhodomicrobium sp.]